MATKKTTATATLVSRCDVCGESFTACTGPESCAANVAEKQNRRMARWFENVISSSESTLSIFATKLAENPAYAMTWSMDAFEASAALDVAKRLQFCFRENGYAATVRAAMQEALRGARSPEHSTSTPSNLVAESKVKVFAEFASHFSRELFS